MSQTDFKNVHFELDSNHMTNPRPRQSDCGPNPAGNCQVVVLDQHGIVEAETVVGSSTATYGVLLQCPKTGSRFTRAHDPCTGALGR